MAVVAACRCSPLPSPGDTAASEIAIAACRVVSAWFSGPTAASKSPVVTHPRSTPPISRWLNTIGHALTEPVRRSTVSYTAALIRSSGPR